MTRQIFTIWLHTVRRVDLQNGDRVATTGMWRHFTLCIANVNVLRKNR